MLFVKMSTDLYENAFYIQVCMYLRKNLVLMVAG